MSVTELILAVSVIVAATVAAILGHLTPELAALLGAAIGYVGKAALTASPLSAETVAQKQRRESRERPDWKGAG